jgi:hypothetical protein
VLRETSALMSKLLCRRNLVRWTRFLRVTKRRIIEQSLQLKNLRRKLKTQMLNVNMIAGDLKRCNLEFSKVKMLST